MVDCGRLLGSQRPEGLVAWWLALALQVAALRLVYPIAVVLVERDSARTALVLAVLSLGLSVVRGVTSDRVTRAVRARLFDALTATIARYPALAPAGSPPVEELESSIAKGAPWVEALVTVTSPSIAGNAVALPIITWLSWERVGAKATVIAGFAMSCGAVVGLLAARHVGKLGLVAWDRYQPVARLIESGFRGRIELGVHQRASVHRTLLLAAVARWSHAERNLYIWGSVAGRLVPAVTVLCALTLATAAGAHPLELLQELIGQPSRSVIAASLLGVTALPAIFSLSRAIADWSNEWPHFEALARFVGSTSDGVPPGAVQVSEAIGAIRINSVRFEYPSRRPGEPKAIVAADLVWQPGETIAVIGPNGSGKTTLTWLLMGIVEPGAGTISIDLGGVSHLPRALTGRISYLPQQPYFEERQSIYEAIRFVAPDALDADIVGVISSLLAERYVGDVRAFIERNVMSLSMGERRVVALARVLLRGSELVILDEPEANLDAELRQRVISALRKAKPRHRMLIVSHDAEFAAVADRVYRMPSRPAN